jgi:hypothetical protein
MEDVLDLYEQPYDPKHPVICLDERPCQLIGDAIIPIPINPGSPKKEHYEEDCLRKRTPDKSRSCGIYEDACSLLSV